MKHLLFTLLLVIAGLAANAQELAPEPASGFTERSAIETRQYMVVSGHELASHAGDAILAQGGNAIDAAIATQMVLNLVEPHASGIGGGGFLLYYDHTNKNVEAFDGRETAPAAATGDMFLDEEGNPPSYQDALKGGLSVGTPGLLRMLEQAHKAHGKLPWKALFTPAIELAEKGFPLSPRLHTVIKSAPYIAQSAEAKALFFTDNGEIKPIGTIIQNPALGQTFRLIAKNGADAFYKGPIAKSIVDTVRNNPFKPGRLTEKDLSKYETIEREPLCDTYRGYRVCAMPPPTSGGITVLQTLKLLERFNLKALKVNSPEGIDVVMQAAKLSFADRNAYVADCDFIPVPIAGMLAPDYIKERSALITPKKPLQVATAGQLPWDKRCGETHYAYEHPSTTHMSIVDKEGNAVSLTSSIEFSFGSGLMTRGFFLNNQLTDFSLVPKKDGVQVANRIEPHKRPRSSMAPILVFDKNDDLYLVLGSPGGSRIISYVLQTLIFVIDENMTLNKAINAPHYATTGDATELEQLTPIEKLADRLKGLGHKVTIGDLTSGLHAIEIKNGRLFSGVDARREGSAVGK
ncbi:MAG: gamma-glutamyltransferase 1 [Rickettsiales bacterium]|jgi:gamma-glutamyltranspeptidase/glutathione hydrolase|nr:gamma-glutamyltransferase 1 [Rickettsiales bacterium]